MISRALTILIALFFPIFALADIAIATRNIRPGDVLQKSDIMVIRGSEIGAFDTAAPLIGTEAKVALYAGRAILNNQIEPAALVERNQTIEINFASNGLSMTTEARALGRGSVGERIRVMNLTSKTSIFGTIQQDGTVRVSK